MPGHYRSQKVIYLLILPWVLLVPRGLTEPADPETYSNNVKRPPNILFILLDDFGYNDLGINSGTEGLTPNLDLLAKEGIRFTRNYVDSTCAATRAGILTGRYPASLGFRPAGRGISSEVETIPELLRAAGYHTRHIGKWHLGFHNREAWPVQQGFDHFFGFLDQFLLRQGFTDDGFLISRPTYYNPFLQTNNEKPLGYTGHLNDLFLSETLSFLEEARTLEEPWFLNLWTYLPHTPLQPADRYKSRFPNNEEGLFLAMLTQLDEMIGAIKKKLEKTDMLSSTIIIVAGDNGGTSRYRDSNAPFSGAKMTFTEGGLRTPLIMKMPEQRYQGVLVDDLVSYLDYLPTILSLAGETVEADMPGRDLMELLEGRSIRQHALFWESGVSAMNSWSVLSENGSHRLSQHFGTAPVLMVVDSPKEQIAENSAFSDEQKHRLTQKLIAKYMKWHIKNRTLSNLHITVDKTGVGSVTGQDLQRLMGFNGFAFGISLRLDENLIRQDRQVIATQPGYWQLSLQGDVIELEMLGVTVQSEVSVDGGCMKIAFSGYYQNQTVNFKDAGAELRLFLEGRQVAFKETPNFHTTDELEVGPTYLGQLPGGHNQINGTLGQPAFVNEYIVSDSEANVYWSNGISDFQVPDCKKPAQGPEETRG